LHVLVALARRALLVVVEVGGDSQQPVLESGELVLLAALDLLFLVLNRLVRHYDVFASSSTTSYSPSSTTSSSGVVAPLPPPLASMSKVTSTCGMPRGAGGMPTSWNLPSVLLYVAISDSPWSTCTSTDGWLSSAVVNVSDFFVGIVVLRSMSFVMTPPLVSMP